MIIWAQMNWELISRLDMIGNTLSTSNIRSNAFATSKSFNIRVLNFGLQFEILIFATFTSGDIYIW